MKRLLIVTPSFLPNTAADMHRVRLVAPYARTHDWHVEILCLDPEDNPSPRDESLLADFPSDIPIHRVRAPQKSWHRWVGRNNLFRRAFRPLADAGADLLAANRFDLVYFSSTAFNTLALGPVWKVRFGVPYVLDYQDPWLNAYYDRTGISPPGGRFKHALTQLQARREEPSAIADASGVTVVSEHYAAQLKARYARVPPTIELPFPDDQTPWPVADQVDPLLWTSVGRGGADLAPAARALFAAFANAQQADPEWFGNVRMRFLGTSYAPADRAVPTLAPLAAEFGLKAVDEHPVRIGLGEARLRQMESGRLIALFSDDPGYRPSKLSGLISSGKPLLIVAPVHHPVVQAVAGIEGVATITFGVEHVQSALDQNAIKSAVSPHWPDSVRMAFDQTRHATMLFEFFDGVLAGKDLHR